MLAIDDFMQRRMLVGRGTAADKGSTLQQRDVIPGVNEGSRGCKACNTRANNNDFPILSCARAQTCCLPQCFQKATRYQTILRIPCTSSSIFSCEGTLMRLENTS